MAIFYVNAVTGNDGNSGASWALAKKTLAAVATAASTNDVVYAHGYFSENFPSKALYWIAKGTVIVDFANLYNGATLSGWNVQGFTFCRAQSYAAWCSGGSNLFQDCVFCDQPGGVVVVQNGASITLINCQFFNHSVAATGGTGGSNTGTFYLDNCVFAGNAVSWLRNTGGATVRARRCVFADVVFFNASAASAIDTLQDWNAYDFSIGKCVINSVNYTSLATWKTLLASPKEINSLDQTLSVGDALVGALRATPSANLLTQGPAGTPIGLLAPAVTLSNNKNSALWTGGVFSNTEIDGNGYIVLSAGQTTGYWRSDVIDFGAALPAQRVEIVTSAEIYPTAYVDYDTGDSPGYVNIRVRGSNSLFAKNDGSPSWTIVPRNAEIGAYLSNHLRYWQIEITLREP